jgi:hypothetical protein
MQVLLSDAIAQLRDELRKAVLEGDDQDIVFVPTEIELELSVTLEAETKAGGGLKWFVDVSAEASASRSNANKVTLKLQAADKDGHPLKVSSTRKTAH